jgi:hypothetical protein
MGERSSERRDFLGMARISAYVAKVARYGALLMILFGNKNAIIPGL